MLLNPIRLTPQKLFAAAVEMAGMLQLELPPYNVEGLLAQITDWIGLPRVRVCSGARSRKAVTLGKK